MANLPVPGEDLSEFGPAMQALTTLQRAFVGAYLEYPTASATAIAEHAGYAGSRETLRGVGHRNMHHETVIAAINEEASKRLRSAGLVAVSAVTEIALNPQHKDHLKAALAIMDRTGHHALSEHKVTVDDKRPQSRKELVEAVIQVAREAGLDDDAVKKLTGCDIVDADFVEMDDSVDEEIRLQMEDM